MVQGRKPDLERRQVMVKLRAQGLTYEAIAKRLGISSQAVHQALCPPAHRRTVRCSGCGGTLADHVREAPCSA